MSETTTTDDFLDLVAERVLERMKAEKLVKQPPAAMTVTQAARELGFSPDVIRGLAHSGVLAKVMAGGVRKVCVTRASVEKLIADSEAAAEARRNARAELIEPAQAVAS